MAQILSYILVLFHHYSSINPSNWMTSSQVFLVTFIFLEGLGLGLSLKLTYISSRRFVARVSFVISMVPTGFVLFGGPVTL